MNDTSVEVNIGLPQIFEALRPLIRDIRGGASFPEGMDGILVVLEPSCDFLCITFDSPAGFFFRLCCDGEAVREFYFLEKASHSFVDHNPWRLGRETVVEGGQAAYAAALEVVNLLNANLGREASEPE